MGKDFWKGGIEGAAIAVIVAIAIALITYAAM
jgi:Na+-driven multidrug efflux pump